MKRRISLLHTVVAASALAMAFSCLADSPDDILAETALVKLTRADYNAALAQIPSDLREEFASSSRRLTMLLNNILQKKTLATLARQEGLQPDAEIQRVSPDDVDAALAAAKVKAIEEQGGHEFDARRASLLPTARENYRLAKDQYKKPEEIKISAIQIGFQSRSKEAALALASTTREKLMAGFDFAAMARQISEDKESAAAGGALPWALEEQVNPTLWRTAVALKRPGDLSEPVQIGNSYIMVRLDDRHPETRIPYEEVEEQILDSMREEYVRNYREEKLDAIRNDPAIKINRAALDALVVRIDPERMKPPSQPPVGMQRPPGMPPAN
jgi:parvulin-like peptidyl-prolyl isomerase